MKRLILIIMMFIFSCSLFALENSVAVDAKTKVRAKEKEDNRFPLGCRNLGNQNELMALKLQSDPTGAEKQTMFFFFNSSQNPVNIYQMRGNDSLYNVFVNNTFNPQQWSVLATNEAKLNFVCTIPSAQSKYGKIVDCADYLKVCQYNNVIFGLNNKGNFWIVKNSNRHGAVRGVVHYGIIPAT